MRNAVPTNMGELADEFNRALEEQTKIIVLIKRPGLPSWEEVGIPVDNILPSLDMMSQTFTDFPKGIHTEPRICLKSNPSVFIVGLKIEEHKDGLACLAPPKKIENVVCVCCGDSFTTDVVMDNGVCYYCEEEYIRQMRTKAVSEYFKEELK